MAVLGRGGGRYSNSELTESVDFRTALECRGEISTIFRGIARFFVSECQDIRMAGPEGLVVRFAAWRLKMNVEMSGTSQMFINE